MEFVDTNQDTGWVQACQRGDQRAFRALFERYREPVFRLAYRFTGDPHDAQDLAQDIFVRVFEQIHSFRGESRFATWLYRVAMNTCLNHQRRIRKNGPLEALHPEMPDHAPSPAAACAQHELSDHVQSAVSALPESLRSVFVLVSMEGLSYQQASEVLDLTVEAVRMRMSRARRELKKQLQTYLQN